MPPSTSALSPPVLLLLRLFLVALLVFLKRTSVGVVATAALQPPNRCGLPFTWRPVVCLNSERANRPSECFQNFSPKTLCATPAQDSVCVFLRDLVVHSPHPPTAL